MNRRDFVKLAGLSAAVACQRRSWAKESEKPSPYPGIKSFEWDEVTIPQLQSRMRSGKATSVSLTKSYLDRIEAIDRQGPAMNSVIEINPDAVMIARTLDHERKVQGARGPLHGIPVLVKDNIDTHDRMQTTAGSLALKGWIAERDAFVVQRLRKAGAVILGKTNLSEWANFRSNRSTSGWSGRGGLTKNPYALDRNPLGSSSGSGAAVAANLCAVAVGTETDGSIMAPSSVNGLVGIKPTVGLLSRTGIIPISHSQDTPGPMARTVADAALLLGAMVGMDADDPATAKSAGQAPADYTRFLDPDGLRGARLGIPRRLFRIQPAAAKLIESAIEEMKRLGAVVIDPADLPSQGKLGNAEFEVLLYEFKHGLNAYLAKVAPHISVHSLADLIRFNELNADKEMPYFQQETLQRSQEKGALTESAYLEAVEKCRRLGRIEGIDAVMDEHRLDALIAPTAGPAHVTDLVHGDRDIGGSSSPAAVAGYPSITVPAGLVAGLPVGISFFGRAFSEPTLLRLVYAFEKATRHRRAPRFLRSSQA